MPVVPGFAFAGASLFAQETGGDYYDFFPGPDAGLFIAIGDASGHGISAALIMEETRASLRALALTRADIGTIVTLSNRCLAADLPTGQFLTLFLSRLDPGTRSLVYCGAGHPSGYVVCRRDRSDRTCVLFHFLASSPINQDSPQRLGRCHKKRCGCPSDEFDCYALVRLPRFLVGHFCCRNLRNSS
jgi:Stage II sporulation protein E (SpoIIE)